MVGGVGDPKPGSDPQVLSAPVDPQVLSAPVDPEPVFGCPIPFRLWASLLAGAHGGPSGVEIVFGVSALL